MRDHVTEERISAYVDGELEGDELKLVEDLLAESAEHRQLLAEFQAMRASLWSIPTSNLPADFHLRVVEQIDHLPVTPTKEPVRLGVRESQSVPWGSVLLAISSLAALVAFTLMLRPATMPSDDPGHPIVSERDMTALAIPVYFREVPQYVMVYDVTITPAGQRSKIVEKLLNMGMIRIEPALGLDDELEQELMAIRAPKQGPDAAEVIDAKDAPAPLERSDKNSVEMIYIASTYGVLDQFGKDLEEVYQVGKDVSQFYYDMSLDSDQRDVMNRLHNSVSTHFAENSNITPADLGYAFRLLFDVELTGVSVPGTATFPTLSMPSKGIGRGDSWETQPGHILLIIRYADAK